MNRVSGPGGKGALSPSSQDVAQWPSLQSPGFLAWHLARAIHVTFLLQICFPRFSKHVLSPYSVQGTTLGAFYVCSHSIF